MEQRYYAECMYDSFTISVEYFSSVKALRILYMTRTVSKCKK